MKIGCHVSIAGGIQNAPKNAADLGCEVFQIFTRSPRGGKALELTLEIIQEFWLEMKKYYPPKSPRGSGGREGGEFVIHTPYYINFGSKNNRIFFGSASVIREELDRATKLKCKYVMTHLGSYKDLGRVKGFKKLISRLSKAVDGYFGSAQLLVEISAGAGEVMGGSFEEIKKIISHPKLKKHNLGVCFDTQHAFASGYDLRTPAAVKKTISDFDKIIGLKNLKVIHINDSKVGLGEKKDRHEHIGKGKIGKEGLRAFVNDSRLKDLNLYLETKHDLVKQDIKTLKVMRKFHLSS